MGADTDKHMATSTIKTRLLTQMMILDEHVYGMFCRLLPSETAQLGGPGEEQLPAARNSRRINRGATQQVTRPRLIPPPQPLPSYALSMRELVSHRNRACHT